MPYQLPATSRTPALVVYVIDVSNSMIRPLGKKRRIDVVSEALSATVRQMVFRSTKGSVVSPRYRIAIIAYSDHVYDIIGGVRGVDEVARMGLPDLSPQYTTETAKAFLQVETLLTAELPTMQDHPAPLVCHMTDGEFSGADPMPIVNRIRAMAVKDGNVLVENIFISDNILSQPVTDPLQWPGITPDTEFATPYARFLQAASSPLPESYRMIMQENNYRLAPNAVMMLPGTTPELVAMGFQMSAATQVR